MSKKAGWGRQCRPLCLARNHEILLACSTRMESECFITPKLAHVGGGLCSLHRQILSAKLWRRTIFNNEARGYRSINLSRRQRAQNERSESSVTNKNSRAASVATCSRTELNESSSQATHFPM